jgi:uncharacterized membrane protein YphA (DoxX/SURF4 family)
VTVDPVIHLTLRLCFICLFVSAAWHKISNIPAFTTSLSNYALLPRSLNSFAVWLLVLAEGLCASLLIIGVRESAWLIAALLSLYSIAMAITLYQGKKDIDCGCGGPASAQPLSSSLLIRNIVLIFFALLLLLPSEYRTLMWLDFLHVTIATTAVVLLYSCFEIIRANEYYIKPTREM